MRLLLKRWPGLKWLYPGIGVKRWIGLLAAGICALSLGLAYILVMIYRQAPLPEAAYYLTLQFLPRSARALLFLGGGLGLVGLALYHLNRSLFSLLLVARTEVPPAVCAAPRVATPGVATPRAASPSAAARGDGGVGALPRIVAIGGGHGLSTLLRGLKDRAGDLTAVVTVADDGGSSGILRQEMGMLPPGDLRDCIAALADAEPLMAQLFQYRFGRDSALDGHSFGNLLIAAMTGITGDFESAVSAVGRVLAVRGRILPSCLASVTLCAEIRDRSEPDKDPYVLTGQSRITRAPGHIERVWLQPDGVRGYPEAIRAILQADLIVLGPGSLYTSVLPNLLIGDIREAVRVSRAVKMYVCNVATERDETAGFCAGDHLRVLHEHIGRGVCEHMLANANTEFVLPEHAGSTMVAPVAEGYDGDAVALADLVDRRLPWRHDPQRLAEAILDFYARLTGTNGAARPGARAVNASGGRGALLMPDDGGPRNCAVRSLGRRNRCSYRNRQRWFH